MGQQGFFEIMMITLISSKKVGGYKIMRNTLIIHKVNNQLPPKNGLKFNQKTVQKIGQTIGQTIGQNFGQKFGQKTFPKILYLYIPRSRFGMDIGLALVVW